MKNCFDLLVCLPWFEFEHALFWRKMPPLLKVAAENWVKIYNINVASPDKVFCNYLGIPKVPLGRSDIRSFSFSEGYFRWEMVHTEAPWVP